MCMYIPSTLVVGYMRWEESYMAREPVEEEENIVRPLGVNATPVTTP